MIASGAWPSASGAKSSGLRPGWASSPLTNRLLPSTSRASTASGLRPAACGCVRPGPARDGQAGRAGGQPGEPHELAASRTVRRAHRNRSRACGFGRTTPRPGLATGSRSRRRISGSSGRSRPLRPAKPDGWGATRGTTLACARAVRGAALADADNSMEGCLEKCRGSPGDARASDARRLRGRSDPWLDRAVSDRLLRPAKSTAPASPMSDAKFPSLPGESTHLTDRDECQTWFEVPDRRPVHRHPESSGIRETPMQAMPL